MFIYALLLLTFALALSSIFLVFMASGRTLQRGWSLLLAGLSLGVFIYLYGTWIYLSVDVKWGFGIVLLLTLLGGFFRKKKQLKAPRVWQVSANVFFSVLFTTLCILYFTGTTGKARAIDLAFPLKTGRYFVLQGGKGLPTNLFHYSLRGAVYAMDIVKLKSDGSRANKIFSPKLEDYEIFGDTLYSPCDGRIVKAIGEDPDNIPPNMARGPHNTNQVLIETENSYVFLAHLKQGSVVVKEGDMVKQGDPLGCVGNSGFSSEPHLHIQAHVKVPGEPWFRSPPRYIHFNGRGYLLYEVIRPQRVEMVQK
ncbi:M23 family metallopeptidase [Chitinophaga rhizophila]|uniref:M23 family metallopeptidase n=1 Tax=Chitinophaga rhizophila TaxID=2866212 RepID=A0ABS7GDZ6_9BACT|nr:M23 family metallopeptidase [Chitinophaga rhizophila]MBW8684887.1 M23 family metallopeptidase [Chitinophaga rhizophila]